MKRFKDAYLGKTCVIVGNGPSLKGVPLSFLTKYPTFGQNKIYLMRGFTPTFYVCADPTNVCRDEVEKMPCPKFVRADTGYCAYPLHMTGKKIFSYDPEKELYEGYSVTYVSLQLAYYMGFTTVLLVGVDHRYQVYPKGQPDPNHFIPSYGWEADTSPKSLEKGAREIPYSMNLARKAYEAVGRKVINLTEGTALDVFEKDKVENWL